MCFAHILLFVDTFITLLPVIKPVHDPLLQQVEGSETMYSPRDLSNLFFLLKQLTVIPGATNCHPQKNLYGQLNPYLR